jgi:tRNA (cmo5U34)-methyltransferase
MDPYKHKQVGFDLLAPFYDTGTRLFLGKALMRSQVCFLSNLPETGTLLILGGGTGKILESVLKLKPQLHVMYVDLSPKMISLSKKRIHKSFPNQELSVDFICGSANDIPNTIRFDCLITPYVLDCFNETELAEVLPKLKSHLNPRGQWLFSDFCIPPSGMRKTFARLFIRLLYGFFRLTCGLKAKALPDFDAAFLAAGYRFTAEKKFRGGLLIAKLYVQA